MIFYLSNTGNSLWAAETVAKETDDKIVSILEALRNDYTYSLSRMKELVLYSLFMVGDLPK